MIKGRLAKDPEIKRLDQQNATVVEARILVNKKGQDQPDAWKVEAWKNDNDQYMSSNYRVLSDFAKKGRFITVIGDIKLNTNNNNGSYSTFPEIKPIAGGIILDNDGQGGNSGNQNQGQFQNQQQGNFPNQQQGSFPNQGQPQQPPQPQQPMGAPQGQSQPGGFSGQGFPGQNGPGSGFPGQ